MSNALRCPSIGPIVGHVTSTSARIWMRGDESGDSRTAGIAALYKDGAYVEKSARYLRLRREHDRTGIVDFDKLKPDSSYVVRMGSLSLNTSDPFVANSNIEVFSVLPPPETWRLQLEALEPNKSSAIFRSHPSGPNNSLSFVFGSCRYPGVLWTKKKADRIFRSILDRFSNPKDGTDPRFFMMVGDQIYADILPKGLGIKVATTEEEFQERYHSAFGAANTSALLSRVPTYMILDDHEIEDNWVQGRILQAEKRNLFNHAIQSYLSFQWSHGPRNYGKQLYYSFDVAGFPFFVIDGRTQRVRDDEDYDLTDNHLLGRPGKGKDYKGQIDLLCEWLVKQQDAVKDRPKFIVSASVFVPNDVSTVKNDRAKCVDDSWAAYPNTRDQLLKTITDNGVQNVVFLSGDIHCSNIAEISFRQKAKGKSKTKSPLKAYSITSSAFYWPYPFADGNPLDYVHDSNKEKDNFVISNGWEMSYKAWDFQQEDNYSQVDINWAKKRVMVRNFGKNGDLLNTETLALA